MHRPPSLLRGAYRLVKNTLFSKADKRKTWRGKLDFVFFVVAFLLVVGPMFSSKQEGGRDEGDGGQQQSTSASSGHTAGTFPSVEALSPLATKSHVTAGTAPVADLEVSSGQIEPSPLRAEKRSPSKTTSLGALTFRNQKMKIDRETLWLARCLYSESRQPREQELVAWIVRNRVETEFRGQATYQEVVLDPYQFSAFNPGRHYSRQFYMHLDPEDDHPGWRRALAIAWYVQHAGAAENPFEENTRHFYSPVSMPGSQPASWADERRRAQPKTSWRPEEHRFRFYKNIGPDK